jgi:hypothetical protein
VSENICDNPSEKLPDTLYHYCGIESFYGIVKSKEIWLSSADFTNDYTEGKVIAEGLKEQLRACDNSFDRQLLSAVSNFPTRAFIACFSQEPDSLSQWRGYAAFGAGFAVGFSLKGLEEACEKLRSDLGAQLVTIDCIRYTEKEQDKLLRTCLTNHQQKHNKACRGGCNGVIGQLREAHNDVAILAAYCKNHGFHEEREWRIALLIEWSLELTEPPALSKRPEFRVSDRGIIPYYTLPFQANAITDIRLGPKNYACENAEALRSFLRTNGYDVGSIKIAPAEATFR